MDLQSMKKDHKEPKATEAYDVEKDDYPYGLKIYLEKDELDKLGMKVLPDVGKKMMLHAKVEVCSVSQSKHEGGEESLSLGLQITDMGFDRVGAPVDADEIYSKA